jgi:hypothetical protein
MPRRSKIEGLPADVKRWIDGALIEGNFSGYEALAAELKAKGYDISKSGLHRYGASFDERLRALKLVTEQAKAVVLAAPDEEDAVTEALVRLTQEKLFSVVMALNVDPETVNLSSITRSIAELARSSIGQKKYAADVREKDAAKLAKLEGEAGSGKSTLDLATIKRIREELYGIV